MDCQSVSELGSAGDKGWGSPACTPLWFVVTGRNCSHTVQVCLSSLLEQESRQWRCIVIVDDPQDDSFALASAYARAYGEKFIVLRNDTRMYKAASFVKALELIPPDGIVAELDLDDSLSSPTAVGDLLLLHTRYDVVWTQHVTVNHTIRPWNTWRSTPLPDGWSRRTAEADRVWSASYFPGHLRTFKKYLFDRVDKSMFYFDGAPLRVAFDMVYYTTLIEMVPPALVCFYGEAICVYNVWPHNDEFLEIDSIAAGVGAAGANVCQSEMDRWFKRLPLPPRLDVRCTVEATGPAITVTRMFQGQNGQATLRYTFEKPSPDRSARMSRWVPCA